MSPNLIPRLFIPDGLPASAALARTTHLAIGAHQDDLEIFAYHGIESCYERTDAWFGGITVTDGAGSARSGPYADFSDKEMQAVRHHEQNEAARLGRYAFQAQLGHSSRVVKDADAADELVAELVELLRAARPDALYLHNPADKHDTHIAVLQRSLQALRQLAPGERPRQVLGCEVWRDLDWLDDGSKVALPVGRLPTLERELLAVFRSQVEGGKDYVAATLGRRRANATFFQSHSVDTAAGFTFALDLTPLLAADAPDLITFTEAHLRRFHEDVRHRLNRF
jgi:LmbE family N-acetylglucosaminyl deacetylase